MAYQDAVSLVTAAIARGEVVVAFDFGLQTFTGILQESF